VPNDPLNQISMH